MAKFSINQILGVIPAMITTFDEDETLDLTRARKLTRFLLNRKVAGLYLTGSTGESFLMTVDERKAFVDAVLAEVNGEVPVMVHVGAISTKLSEELARHAERAGADAVSSVPPIYWKFSDEEIFDYYKELSEASGLPFVIYNIALAGLISFEMITALGSLENVKGIKFTANSHYDMFRIKETLGKDFMIYSGTDEMALSGLAFGADGLIGSNYNVMSQPFMKLFDEMRRGNLDAARQIQEKVNRIIFIHLKHDLIPSIKQTLIWDGCDGGPCRRPFQTLTGEKSESLRADLLKVRSEIGDCGLDYMKNLDL